MKLSFDEAKQQVAETTRINPFPIVNYIEGGNSMDDLYRQAYELGCNEAVKADRALIIETCIHKREIESFTSTEILWEIDDEKFHELPLPFSNKS